MNYREVNPSMLKYLRGIKSQQGVIYDVTSGLIQKASIELKFDMKLNPNMSFKVIKCSLWCHFRFDKNAQIELKIDRNDP